MLYNFSTAGAHKILADYFTNDGATIHNITVTFHSCMTSMSNALKSQSTYVSTTRISSLQKERPETQFCFRGKHLINR